jgi:hypothetical protein
MLLEHLDSLVLFNSGTILFVEQMISLNNCNTFRLWRTNFDIVVQTIVCDLHINHTVACL